MASENNVCLRKGCDQLVTHNKDGLMSKLCADHHPKTKSKPNRSYFYIFFFYFNDPYNASVLNLFSYQKND